MLSSETGENQLAAGIVCGMILGFSPGLSLQTVLVFTLLFFFRIQMGMAFGSAVFFKLLAYGLDPIFHSMGCSILETESLRPLFVSLYNMPIVPWTRFNNSITMGAGAVALILAIPVFFLSKVLIRKYREKIVAKIRETKFWRVLQASFLYKWYQKVEQLRD